MGTCWATLQVNLFRVQGVANRLKIDIFSGSVFLFYSRLRQMNTTCCVLLST